MNNKKVKRKSLTRRLVINMIGISLIGMIFVTVASYFISQRIILSESLQKTQNIVSYESEKMNKWLDIRKSMVKAVGKDLVVTNDVSKVKEFCAEQAKINPEYMNVYVGFSDDIGIFSGDSPDPTTWKATQRGWYKQAMAGNGEVIVTDPYRDALTGLTVITITQYIGQIEGLDACFAIDVDITELLKIVTDTEIDGGYVFLANDSGEIIAHPDSQFVPSGDDFYSMTDNSTYSQVYNKQKNGLSVVKLKDESKVSQYFIPISLTSAPWTVYASVEESVILASLNSSLILIVLLYVVVIGFTGVFAAVTCRRLIKFTLRRLTDALYGLSNGDLSFVARTNDTDDEIGILYGNFARLVSTLKGLIADMDKMNAMHTQGDRDYRIDESKYTGVFQDVVKGVHATTFMYVNNFMEMLDVMREYGNGNFEANIRPYPGKLAEGNKIVDELRSNLTHINNEINNLALTAMDGNLTTRADNAGFNGQWLKIIDNLNRLVEATDIPIHEASAVLEKMSRGDLNTKMSGNYKGDFSLIKDMLNKTVVELSGYISETREALKKVETGDFTQQIHKTFLGDFVDIKDSVNTIIRVQNNILQRIVATTEQVHIGSAQIANSSDSLATGTTEQAASVSTLTDSISAINAQTQMNAQNAKTADELSIQSMESAQNGNTEMKNMLEAMNGIKDSSTNIAKIIAVIENIAFQTNLLALNASVEAARAGEHGKGFAVVAEEVRSLAERSQKASQESRELINDTVTRINSGTQIANATSSALTEIVTNVQSVSKLISNISDASSQQALAVSEISNGINQISDVVQSNSATSEESAAAAAELSSQAESLSELLSMFKL